MKLEIRVTAGAKKNFINLEEVPIKVYLTAPPIDGKANKAVVEILADHYGVAKSKVKITKGLKSKFKTITIGD